MPTQYMHLIGTEQIQSAANRMVEAAHEMNRAADTIHFALQRHEQMMQDLMIKMDDLIDAIDGEEET